MGHFWFFLKVVMVIGLSTACCYAGGNPEDALSFPQDSPPKSSLNRVPQTEKTTFTGPADWVYEASDWILNLYITQKNTRSQGSHGVLLFEGKQVKGRPGEILALPIGTVQYQGPSNSKANLWDDSGWQMKDPLVKPKVNTPPNLKPRNRQSIKIEELEKEFNTSDPG